MTARHPPSVPLPEFTWWDDGGAMLDQIICSCGWESATFFDGAQYAYEQWKKHVKEKHDAGTKL